MPMIAHNIECLDDVGVLERRADTKLSSDLFVVLLFRFARAAWTELLDRIDYAPVLCFALDEADCAPSSGPKRSTKFAILFGNRCVGRVSKGCKGCMGA